MQVSVTNYSLFPDLIPEALCSFSLAQVFPQHTLTEPSFVYSFLFL